MESRAERGPMIAGAAGIVQEDHISLLTLFYYFCRYSLTFFDLMLGLVAGALPTSSSFAGFSFIILFRLQSLG